MLQHLKLNHVKEFASLKVTSTGTETEEIEMASTSRIIVTSALQSANSQSQPNSEAAFFNAQIFASGGFNHSKITKCIVEMIIMDNLPFSHVEGKGFLKLMKEQHALYKVPTGTQ